MDPAHPSISAISAISAEELLEHAGFLRRLAARLVADPAQADDLVQDTLVRALEHRPAPGPVREWLATVARRLAHNERRGERRRRAREEDAAREERLDPDLSSLERIELQRALFELVLGLPEEQRTVLYLRYYEDLAPGAIAARLGAPVKTIKTRHTRAVHELRARLDARSGGDRRAWLSALAPLAAPRGSGRIGVAPAGAVTGGLAMKKALVVVLGLVVAVGGWLGLGAPGIGGREATRAGARPEAGFAGSSAERVSLPPSVEAPEAERIALAAAAPAAVTTGALRVRLSWSDGTPAGGIGLDAFCEDDPAPRRERFRALTDDEGVATFSALFAGEVRVVPDARFGGRLLETDVVAGETHEVVAKLAGLDVHGRVVDAEGRGIDAEVWSQEGSPDSGRRLARTVAGGSFRLRDLLKGAVIGARAPGHCASAFTSVEDLPRDADGVRRATLRLESPGGGVRGIVLDPDGRPLPGAWVCGGPRGGYTVSVPSGEHAQAAHPPLAATGEDGSFVLPGNLPSGRQPLWAQARGFPTWEGAVDVVEGSTAAVEIRLARGARVEGRVVDATGEPVEGAHVIAAEEVGGGWHENVFPASEARTDGNGRFALDWLAPGERELNASCPRRPELGRARVRVACAEGERTSCELRLDLGRTIAGCVVDEAGRPLEGWNVESSTTATYRRQARTDSAGRFLLANLADRVHDLVVRGPEYGPQRARVESVAPGTEGLEIVVAGAHARPGRVRGRLVDASGASLERIRLTLWLEGGHEGRSVELDPRDGAFEGQAAPGRYRLLATRGTHTMLATEPFDVAEDATTELGALETERLGSLVLVVRGPKPEELADRRLWLVREGRPSAESLTLADGALRSGEIASGTWTLTFLSKEWWVPPEVEVAAGETTALTIDAVRAVACTASIERADGEALRRVALEARRPDGTLLLRREGDFESLRPTIEWDLALPPGPVVVQAQSADLAGSGSIELAAPAGSLRIVLR